ncbi:cytochrome P450 [Mycena maculata]|uniref:Cytochrome P450 n=1 Tax=Mycena maculata TaxID=230809 RepID=A0AAD7J5S6_9AGAR|nr:cytochrome P450 [Mycena maculata]
MSNLTNFMAISNAIRSTNIHAIFRSIPSNFGAVDAGILFGSSAILYILIRRFSDRRSTPLKGPPTTFGNFLFGVLPFLRNVPDVGAVYEGWASRYGAVFSVPGLLGSRTICLTDVKAIAHFSAEETYGYVGTPPAKRFNEKLLGRGLFWAEGDSHKRQRRALNPAFSNVAIKNMTSIFFDSAYKAKAAWDAMLESSGPSEGIILEVQLWMNHISLDTIGLAGFSHDFGTLSGNTSNIASIFDAIGSKESVLDTVVFLLSLIVPIVDNVPTVRHSLLNQLTKAMQDLGNGFLETTDANADKSVIGFLMKSVSSEKISHEEVMSQIMFLIVAGYETTAISLTWALIELSRNPAIQTKLRDELLRSGDPTWEELTSHGSLLDAFTCEVLRMHPPLPEIERMAAKDDCLPLSTPIQTARGELVDTVFVRKGQYAKLSVECINRSEALWGPDAKVFNPGRWLDESNGVDQQRAQELQGYRHLLTFSDGPRICLGKVFALTEFKTVLSVLLRNFVFEFPNGPDTAIGRRMGLLPRPGVEGEAGYDVPLRIRHYVPTELA